MRGARRPEVEAEGTRRGFSSGASGNPDHCEPPAIRLGARRFFSSFVRPQFFIGCGLRDN